MSASSSSSGCPWKKGCGAKSSTCAMLCRNPAVQRLWYTLSFQDISLSLGAFLLVTLSLWLVRRGGYTTLQLLLLVMWLRTAWALVQQGLHMVRGGSRGGSEAAAAAQQEPQSQEGVSGVRAAGPGQGRELLREEVEDGDEGQGQEQEEGGDSSKQSCARALSSLFGVLVQGASCVTSKLFSAESCPLVKVQGLLALGIAYFVASWISLPAMLYLTFVFVLGVNAFKRFLPGPYGMVLESVQGLWAQFSPKVKLVMSKLPFLHSKQD